jgi:ribosomal protein L11 methyltransferase
MNAVTRYLAVSCQVPGVTDERLACLLEEFSVLGSVLEGTTDGQSVTIYVAPEHEAELERLRRALAELGAVQVSADTVESADWISAYTRLARPFPVGQRWWIDPHPGGSGDPPDGRIRLAVEPSEAFGSGSHESTQLVLLALQDVPAARRSVLDVGTGSGILALASLALGAREVVGLDLDAESVWTARRVSGRQGREDRPLLIVATMAAIGDCKFDIVLCNMMSSEFIPLFQDLGRVLGSHGRLILSGALFSERTVVVDEITRVGLRVVREQRLGEWVGWTVVHDSG